jgi:hypothetical protein
MTGVPGGPSQKADVWRVPSSPPIGRSHRRTAISPGFVLMAILGVAGIPYDRWFKFAWPLLLKLAIAAAMTLIIAVRIGYA